MVRIIATVLCLIIFFNLFGFSQQSSSIKVDSGNNNRINITQEGKDSLQKSSVDIKKSDSNKIELNQKQLDSTKAQPTSGLFEHMNNLNIVLSIVVSVIVIVGFLKGIKAFRKSKKGK